MSLVWTSRGASARLDHRLGVGDGQTMRVAAKIGLCLPPPPLCAHTLSCFIGSIPAPHCAASPIRSAPALSTVNGLDSNPHSATTPLASCQTARGFLPRGLSDAYRRPC